MGRSGDQLLLGEGICRLRLGSSKRDGTDSRSRSLKGEREAWHTATRRRRENESIASLLGFREGTKGYNKGGATEVGE